MLLAHNCPFASHSGVNAQDRGGNSASVHPGRQPITQAERVNRVADLRRRAVTQPAPWGTQGDDRQAPTPAPSVHVLLY